MLALSACHHPEHHNPNYTSFLAKKNLIETSNISTFSFCEGQVAPAESWLDSAQGKMHRRQAFGWLCVSVFNCACMCPAVYWASTAGVLP